MDIPTAIIAVQEMWDHAAYRKVFSHEARPVAFAMFTSISPTTLSASLIATDEFIMVWREFLSWGLKYFKPDALEAGYRRVECRTLARHREARSMLERLGFVMEAEIPDFGLGGETFFQYAWRLSDHVPSLRPEDERPASPADEGGFKRRG